MPLTPAQQQAIDALLAGTFDRLDTAPRMQPSYTLDQIYGGILPAQSGPVPAPPPNMARGAQLTVPASQTIQPNSSMGTIKTANPIAGSVALPANVRPSSVWPDPGFDPLAWVQGAYQYNPITGLGGTSVQAQMQNVAPTAPVQKLPGRPPDTSVSAYSDPSVPKLTPLWPDSTTRLPASQPGLPSLYGTMPTTRVAGTEPLPPLPIPRPSTAPAGLTQVAAPMVPRPMPQVSAPLAPVAPRTAPPPLFNFKPTFSANENFVSPSQQYANANAGQYRNPASYALRPNERLGTNGYVYTQKPGGGYEMSGNVNTVPMAPGVTRPALPRTPTLMDWITTALANQPTQDAKKKTRGGPSGSSSTSSGPREYTGPTSIG